MAMDWAAAEPEPTDEMLAALAADGDKDAYTILFHRHHRSVYRWFLRRLWSDRPDLAEELAVTTMADAWITLSRMETPPRSFTPWLYGAARNLLRQHIREHGPAQARLAADDEHWDPRDPDSSQGFADIDRLQGVDTFRQLVRDALATMPAKYADPVRIFLDENLTGRALGERLGSSAAEASRNLSEGKQILLSYCGALAVARFCRQECAQFDQILREDGWESGPFNAALRNRVRRHLISCAVCADPYRRAMTAAELLPVVVPALFVLIDSHAPTDLHLTAQTVLPSQTPSLPAQSDPSLNEPNREDASGLSRRRRRRGRTGVVAAIVLVILLGGAAASVYLTRQGNNRTPAVNAAASAGPSVGGSTSGSIVGTMKVTPQLLGQSVTATDIRTFTLTISYTITPSTVLPGTTVHIATTFKFHFPLVAYSAKGVVRCVGNDANGSGLNWSANIGAASAPAAGPTVELFRNPDDAMALPPSNPITLAATAGTPVTISDDTTPDGCWQTQVQTKDTTFTVPPRSQLSIGDYYCTTIAPLSWSNIRGGSPPAVRTPRDVDAHIAADLPKLAVR